MNVPCCPRCYAPLRRVECVSLWSQHFICESCRAAFVWDFGTLALCKNPSEHVVNWSDLFVSRATILPPIQAGPMGMGLL